jgi:hypothetical protein
MGEASEVESVAFEVVGTGMAWRNFVTLTFEEEGNNRRRSLCLKCVSVSFSFFLFNPQVSAARFVTMSRLSGGSPISSVFLSEKNGFAIYSILFQVQNRS